MEGWKCCPSGFLGAERAFVTQPVTELREKLGGEALAPPGASPMPNKGASSP